MTKASSRTRSTGTLERRAASRLPPTAMTRTPKVVRRRTRVRMTNTTTVIQIGQRRPRNSPLAMFVTLLGSPEMTAPFVSARAIPRAISSMPRVAMNEGTRSLVTMAPLAMPMAVPVPMPARTPRITDCESRMTRAETTLASATPEPTERSSWRR